VVNDTRSNITDRLWWRGEYFPRCVRRSFEADAYSTIPPLQYQTPHMPNTAHGGVSRLLPPLCRPGDPDGRLGCSKSKGCTSRALLVDPRNKSVMQDAKKLAGMGGSCIAFAHTPIVLQTQIPGPLSAGPSTYVTVHAIAGLLFAVPGRHSRPSDMFPPMRSSHRAVLQKIDLLHSASKPSLCLGVLRRHSSCHHACPIHCLIPDRGFHSALALRLGQYDSFYSCIVSPSVSLPISVVGDPTRAEPLTLCSQNTRGGAMER